MMYQLIVGGSEYMCLLLFCFAFPCNPLNDLKGSNYYPHFTGEGKN